MNNCKELKNNHKNVMRIIGRRRRRKKKREKKEKKKKEKSAMSRR